MSHAEDHEGTRRDFLYYATAGAGAVTAGAAVWPLVHQMNPSADVQALSSIRVDVSAVEPGTQISVKFLGKPVFIRRRTQEEIDDARAVELSDLPDTDARNENLGSVPADDTSHSPASSSERLAWDGARAALEASLAVPRASQLGLEPELLHALLRAENLIRIAEDLVYLPEQITTIEGKLGQLPEHFTVAHFRDLMGITRRQAVPLLEWLDTRGVTVRHGDFRMVR